MGRYMYMYVGLIQKYECWMGCISIIILPPFIGVCGCARCVYVCVCVHVRVNVCSCSIPQESSICAYVYEACPCQEHFWSSLANMTKQNLFIAWNLFMSHSLFSCQVNTHLLPCKLCWILIHGYCYATTSCRTTSGVDQQPSHTCNRCCSHNYNKKLLYIIVHTHWSSSSSSSSSLLLPPPPPPPHTILLLLFCCWCIFVLSWRFFVFVFFRVKIDNTVRCSAIGQSSGEW